MYNNTKQAFLGFGEKKEPDRVTELLNNGAAFVYPKDFNNAHKYLGYMGDAALVGIGAGMSWHALKKFVEHSYRKRLEKAVRNSTDVGDFYNSRTAAINNSYIGASKKASLQKESISENVIPISKAQSDNTKFYRHIGHTPKGTEMVAVQRGQGTLNDIALRMAENPTVYNTLAFASIPAIFAGSVWAGNSISKAINDRFKPKDIRGMTKERAKARKRYDDAALTLRNITLGGMDKTSSVMEKRAIEPLTATLLALAAAGTATAGTLWATQRKTPFNVAAHVPNPYPTQNSTLNGLASLGVGALGLMAVPASYKFVQSMRKGYKKQVEGISDVTRAAQAWNAVRDSRGEDFATLRAGLADEPDLLDYSAHGLKKKRNA